MNDDNLLNPIQNNNQPIYEQDSPSFLAALISFFMPNIGVILYFLKRKKTPLLAKSFRKGVKVFLIIQILAPIIIILMLFIFSFMLFLI